MEDIGKPPEAVEPPDPLELGELAEVNGEKAGEVAAVEQEEMAPCQNTEKAPVDEETEKKGDSDELEQVGRTEIPDALISSLGTKPPEEMEENGGLMNCCGTMKHMRGGPSEFQKSSDLLKRTAKQMRTDRGEIHYRHTSELTLVCWLDNNWVRMGYALPDVSDDMGSVQRRAQETNSNSWITKTVKSPLAIKYYNKYMSGVDRHDQLCATSDNHIKTHRWYLAIFWRLFHSTIVNTYIIRKMIDPSSIRRSGVAETMRQLILDFMVVISANKPKSAVSISNRHQIIRLDGRFRCVHCKKKNLLSRTRYGCSSCKAALCFSCFYPFHD